jgi:hypothetical protein
MKCQYEKERNLIFKPGTVYVPVRILRDIEVNPLGRYLDFLRMVNVSAPDSAPLSF